MESLSLHDKMEMVQCDVSDPTSVTAVASSVKNSLDAKGVKLYALGAV